MARRSLLAALAAGLLAGCCDPEYPETCHDPDPAPPCQDRLCGQRCFECSAGLPPWACEAPALYCTRDRLCMGGQVLCD